MSTVVSSATARSAPPGRGDWRTEGVRYYQSRAWPKSPQPRFFDAAEFPSTRILEENFETIRDEVLAYFTGHAHEMGANFTPYNWREEGWRTVNLYAYFLRYAENCAKLPKTDAIVRSIPGMALAQIAVLEPGTTLKAHFGDCNALVRSHLGLLVPGALPELGMRVHNEYRTWETGKVFCISIAQRHYAWNRTDSPRVVLVVDTVRPGLLGRRFWIGANALATIAMKLLATRFPALKRLPAPLVTAIRVAAAPVFLLRIALSRRGAAFAPVAAGS